MKRRRVAAACTFLAIALLLFAALFLVAISSAFLNSILTETEAILHDPETQLMIVFCLALYGVAFSDWERRKIKTSWKHCPTHLWLLGFWIFILSSYAFAYQNASASLLVLAVEAGIVFGKATALWARSRVEFLGSDSKVLWLLSILACLLAGTVFWQADFVTMFGYQNVQRWSGPWDNPNTYGMLMSVGLVLAVGQLVQSLKFKVQSTNYVVQPPKATVQSRGFCFTAFRFPLFSLAAIACGIGLFKSYSRGAWLATLIGLIYLFSTLHRSSVFRFPLSAFRFPALRYFCVLLLSVLVISFWQFRFTDWRPARRVFSVFNINDFSWRNRVTAWNGALHMTVHRPWFGYGWREAEVVYKTQYCPPNLESGVAIQMNDYFMLGISAGLPALLCFLMYVALSLRTPYSALPTPHSESPAPTLNLESGTLNFLQATCRAGAIVLLVGFWFDGGLFKLATGSIFWILLELGRADVGKARRLTPSPEPSPSLPRSGGEGRGEVVPRAQRETSFDVQSLMFDVRRSQMHGKEPGAKEDEVASRLARQPIPGTAHGQIWLHRLAWTMASAAALQSIILLGTPFLPVNNVTLAIARRWLVPPKAVPDLNLLATLDPRPSTLHVLLEHASLANYNRELINWKLDDEIYRNNVLSPDVYHDPHDNSALRTPHSALRAGDLNWRRELWEYFYPPVRHEADPQSAAQIVLKFLRERITVDSGTGVSPMSPLAPLSAVASAKADRPSVAPKSDDGGPSLSIDEMWRQQKADPEGFEALKVAAFRSVGVPARLNARGQAEVLVDGQWNPP